MDGIASLASATASASAEDAAGLAILKKSQDLMAQQAASLLSTLPPPPHPARAPSPPGVGGRLDILA